MSASIVLEPAAQALAEAAPVAECRDTSNADGRDAAIVLLRARIHAHLYEGQLRASSP